MAAVFTPLQIAKSTLRAVVVVCVLGVFAPGCNGCNRNETENSVVAPDPGVEPAYDRHRAIADRGASQTHRAFSLPADLRDGTFAKVNARFIAFGDTGLGDEVQRNIAGAMSRFCAAKRCDFALHLGDIVYPDGIQSAGDHQIAAKFEQPYQHLNVPIWLSLGNHDHYGNPLAWVKAYGPKGTRRGPKALVDAQLPATYYTFFRGGVRFIALDTVDISTAQANWAIGALTDSRRAHEPWVVVFGHHPRRSYGAHRDATPKLAKWLDHVLCHRADLFIAGHDHDKQIIRPHCGVHQIVSGAGAQLRPTSTGTDTVFAKSSLGWAYVVADKDTLRVAFHNSGGDEEFARTYTRNRPIPVCDKDGICNGMCRKDPDCRPGMCGADRRCDPSCTDDPDCGHTAGDTRACACDRHERACEVQASRGDRLCGCDPACQAGLQPCQDDGYCDRGCDKQPDSDCVVW